MEISVRDDSLSTAVLIREAIGRDHGGGHMPIVNRSQCTHRWLEARTARWSNKNIHRPFPLSKLVYEVIKHQPTGFVVIMDFSVFPLLYGALKELDTS